MERSVQIIVHGRGNAWPVLLGETHPFYDRTDPRDLANASFSLLASRSGSVITDILIDAGHGTIQSLITGMNRIPDTICLTHGHMDHTLGVDWVVQSFRKKYGDTAAYPIHATLPVFRFLVSSYPQLAGLTELRELEPGISRTVGNDDSFTLTAYPVYHGMSAQGASMLLFESADHRLLFTGDLITPLLRPSDYKNLKNTDLMVVDTNNRFPYPGANHWSFSGKPGDPMARGEYLDQYLRWLSPVDLAGIHQPENAGRAVRSYFGTFLQAFDPAKQPFTILELIRKITPRKVVLVHYSGAEDLKYYREPILTAGELSAWANRTARAAGIRSEFLVPSPGQLIQV
ncbi:MAG TPA: MBL fold metallo-hydrolase [Bacteroides sp.]|nr:MBL fold metallo-hydrolase [Bacteroides sp.]